jgi:Uma2 family endonuclease
VYGKTGDNKVATTTRLTFEEFQNLPEQEGIHFELDEGELLMEASPAARHNLIRQRIAMQLMNFAEAHSLGIVLEEMDFRLSEKTVRNPDVSFVTTEHLKTIDLDRSPIEGAPALAVEVISPTNTAQDTVKKIHQYLQAGCRFVWIVYPALRLVEIHSLAGVRQVREPDSVREDTLFPGLVLSLPYILDGQQ